MQFNRRLIDLLGIAAFINPYSYLEAAAADSLGLHLGLSSGKFYWVRPSAI